MYRRSVILATLALFLLALAGGDGVRPVEGSGESGIFRGRLAIDTEQFSRFCTSLHDLPGHLKGFWGSNQRGVTGYLPAV